MVDQITITRGSVDYVDATVTADDTIDNTVEVEIAITREPAEDATWLPAAWVDSAGLRRKARTVDVIAFTDAAFLYDSYTVYVRATDSPEAPILRAGTIHLNR